MNRVSSIFSQILQVISRPEFASIVGRHKGERRARVQLQDAVDQHAVPPARARIRCGKICGGLATCEGKLRHLGLDGAPSRSTLSYANEHRPWRFTAIWPGG